jgi:hypothetical protein
MRPAAAAVMAPSDDLTAAVDDNAADHGIGLRAAVAAQAKPRGLAHPLPI